MKLRLRQIENQLQSIIEGNATRLFPTADPAFDLLARLTNAMQEAVKKTPDGRQICPNLIILEAARDQAKILDENQSAVDELAQALFEISQENGYEFEGPLVIRAAGSDDIPPGELRIKAYHSREGLAQTSTIEPGSPAQAAQTAARAFLVIDGTQIYEITQSVTNIGRRSDNDIIIDDPRISRRHAQLRLVRGRFMLSDLGSTGGTFVNGERIRQRALLPGDVVSLSGIPLVFGQETQPTGTTQKAGPA